MSRLAIGEMIIFGKIKGASIANRHPLEREGEGMYTCVLAKIKINVRQNSLTNCAKLRNTIRIHYRQEVLSKLHLAYTREYQVFEFCPIHIAAEVLIWHYGTTVGARATYSGVKHEVSVPELGSCCMIHLIDYTIHACMQLLP